MQFETILQSELTVFSLSVCCGDALQLEISVENWCSRSSFTLVIKPEPIQPLPTQELRKPGENREDVYTVRRPSQGVCEDEAAGVLTCSIDWHSQ